MGSTAAFYCEGMMKGLGYQGYYKVEEGGCSCILDIYKSRGYIYISSLITRFEDRRKGHAKSLVKQIVRIGKRLGLRVELTASPWGYKQLSLENTVTFYEKCGLKCVVGPRMFGDSHQRMST